MPSSPISSCGPTATSGSAPRSRSTPSPSISARPSTAGSRRISTNSTATPRPSSSRRPRTPIEAHGLGGSTSRARSNSARSLFAETLEGAKLMTNARHLRGSAWLNFNRLICGSWSHFNGRSHVVLMGDAAHTAHFAIGSGTKLAFDDAIELANQFDAHGHGRETIPAVLEVLRGDPPRRRRAHPERGAQRHGMVRGGRATATPTRWSRSSSSIRC